MLHAKAFVGDGADVLAGTCNLEAWSLKRFFEIDLLVRSRELAGQFEERFSAPAELVSAPGRDLTGRRERLRAAAFAAISPLLRGAMVGAWSSALEGCRRHARIPALGQARSRRVLPHPRPGEGAARARRERPGSGSLSSRTRTGCATRLPWQAGSCPARSASSSRASSSRRRPGRRAAPRRTRASLPLGRRDRPEPARELVQLVAGVARSAAHRAGRIVLEPRAVAPCPGRPYRARLEPTPAVGTDVVEHGFDARSAEGALVAADPSVSRVRREVLVAELAVRSQLEHVTTVRR